MTTAQGTLGVAHLAPDLGEAIERLEVVRLQRQRPPEVANRGRHVVAREMDEGAAVEALGKVGRQQHDIVHELERDVVVLGAERLGRPLHQQGDGIAAGMAPQTLDRRLDLLGGLGRIGCRQMGIEIGQQLRFLVRRRRQAIRGPARGGSIFGRWRRRSSLRRVGRRDVRRRRRPIGGPVGVKAAGPAPRRQRSSTLHQAQSPSPRRRPGGATVCVIHCPWWNDTASRSWRQNGRVGLCDHKAVNAIPSQNGGRS